MVVHPHIGLVDTVKTQPLEMILDMSNSLDDLLIPTASADVARIKEWADEVEFREIPQNCRDRMLFEGILQWPYSTHLQCFDIGKQSLLFAVAVRIQKNIEWVEDSPGQNCAQSATSCVKGTCDGVSYEQIS